MITITTHVLDIVRGHPARELAVGLDLRSSEGEWVEVGRATTDSDGRVKGWTGESRSAGPGLYRLRFESGEYFRAQNIPHFFPEVHVVFEIAETGGHYHVPILLGPFGYSTYRGS